MSLHAKQILVGVTGSIAAYKSAELVRRLREKGAIVRVAMTENAKRFITPLTMQAVSGFPIHEDLFDVHAEAAMGHIELARWADLILVAPATADFIARLALGNANDLLSTLCLATNAKIALAPAMNQAMWHNLITQENIERLQTKNIDILGPESGSQACGDIGLGRMMEPAAIINKISEYFVSNQLSHKKILITAGPTIEPIDPIRFITNHSSGKMGYALAEAALAAGAEVLLVSGPVAIKKPKGVERISVKTAQEMHEIVMQEIPNYDIFFAVAAVSDYRTETVAPHKIHKNAEVMQLKLIKNPDIILEVSQRTSKPFTIGFAAETENLIENAKTKLQQKNMDMIIANLVGEHQGMNEDDNQVVIIDKNSEMIHLPLMSKQKLAREIISIVATKVR